MFRQLLVVFSLSYGLVLSAQASPFSEIAADVCSCMETLIDQPPRLYARRCLRAAAAGKTRQISQALQQSFDVDRPADIDLLAGLLIDPLADNCPFLQAFYEHGPEPELRWSDQPGEKDSQLRYTFPKGPPSDITQQTLTERPPLGTITGTVLSITREGIRLETESGVEELEVPARVSRLLDLEAGKEVQLRYRREWRLQEDKIVLVVVK